MDGFRSTENILAFHENMCSDPSYSHIKKPKIYAMADFGSEYREITDRCKQVGMSGILFKPVAKKGLIT